MIKVRKSETVPLSLLTTKTYDGQDVQQQLHEDQDEKCYLCERKPGTAYHIEHRQSQTHYDDRRQVWSNLLLSCSYCNGKKGARFDDILDPLTENIEEIIEQRFDSGAKRCLFCSERTDGSTQNTIGLLHLIFNGANPKMRNKREKIFFDEFQSEMNAFLLLVTQYLSGSNGEEVRNKISANLSNKSLFLGFKYWVVMGNETLKSAFAEDVRWNK